MEAIELEIFGFKWIVQCDPSLPHGTMEFVQNDQKLARVTFAPETRARFIVEELAHASSPRGVFTREEWMRKQMDTYGIDWREEQLKHAVELVSSQLRITQARLEQAQAESSEATGEGIRRGRRIQALESELHAVRVESEERHEALKHETERLMLALHDKDALESRLSTCHNTISNLSQQLDERDAAERALREDLAAQAIECAELEARIEVADKENASLTAALADITGITDLEPSSITDAITSVHAPYGWEDLPIGNVTHEPGDLVGPWDVGGFSKVIAVVGAPYIVGAWRFTTIRRRITSPFELYMQKHHPGTKRGGSTWKRYAEGFAIGYAHAKAESRPVSRAE